MTSGGKYGSIVQAGVVLTIQFYDFTKVLRCDVLPMYFFAQLRRYDQNGSMNERDFYLKKIFKKYLSRLLLGPIVNDRGI